MRILVIEESSIARAIIFRELVGAGYEVTLAATGEAGLAAFHESTPDLVTVAIGLPDLDGFEVATLIRTTWVEGTERPAQGSDTPIVFLTADDSLEARNRGFAVGATEFITKPFVPGMLQAAVDRILRPGGEFHGRSALIADDSALVRTVVKNCLKPLGLTFLEAKNGEAALHVALQHAADLDLIVTDYLMPGMDGNDLCRRLKQIPALKDVPIVAMSGVEDHETMLGMFRSGVSDYIIKPFTSEIFVARALTQLRARASSRGLARSVEELKQMSTQQDRLLSELQHHASQAQAELTLAAELQKRVFGSLDAPSFLRFASYAKPASHVSGDVLFARAIQDGGYLCVVGDATGHGVAAALTTMLVVALLNSMPDTLLPHEILERLNRQLCGYELAGRFMSCIAVLLHENGTLITANAGHPSGILTSPTDSAPRMIESSGPPLGLFADIAYEDTEYQLAAGDRVLLITDGLPEAARPEGNEFGVDHVAEFAQAHSHELPQQLIVALTTALDAHLAGAELLDDVTIAAIQYGEAPAAVSTTPTVGLAATR